MTYAITTKYLGPTSTKAARIKASDHTGESYTIAFDHEAKSDRLRHWKAAAAFVLRYRPAYANEQFLGVDVGPEQYMFIHKGSSSAHRARKPERKHVAQSIPNGNKDD